MYQRGGEREAKLATRGAVATTGYLKLDVRLSWEAAWTGGAVGERLNEGEEDGSKQGWG